MNVHEPAGKAGGFALIGGWMPHEDQ